MKKCIVSILLLVLATGCDGVLEKQEQSRDAQNREWQRKVGGSIITDLQYWRDGEQGPCFVAGWHGDSHGGPVLSYVPCSEIPSHRKITVVKPQ